MSRKLIYSTLFLVALGAVAVQAQDLEWIRAAYWDQRYPTNWASDADSVAVRDGLQAAGYEILDADQLKTWMEARIADKELSVVVFCRDIPPDTVVETRDANCTLRKYLDAGGKIVVYADIPLYNQGHADGTSTNWGEAGINSILGVGNVAVWDTNNTVTITEIGAKWGLTQTWATVRPNAAADVDVVLATDDAGNAAAWVKHYVTNDTFRGFVRLWDRGGRPPVADIIRVAEYIALKASNPSPPDGAEGVTLPLFTWDAGSFGLWHDVYLGTSPELTEADLIVPRLYATVHYHAAGFTPGTTYYWRIDEIADDESVVTGDVWTFSTAPLTAFKPSPRDGDKWIDPNADLSWSPGQGATEHELYFGADENAVANRDAGVFEVKQYTTTYDPGPLEVETTYYWAVDEPGQPGQVWSFTTGGPGITGGIKGEYFGNMTLTGLPALTRTDPSVDFGWGEAAPDESLPIDQFSVRWTADFEIAAADTYTFTTNTDDGARLWLNDVRIIDQWVDQGPTDALSDPIYLEPGIYSLRMEYYENGGGATARLYWQTPSVGRQIIPAGPLQPPRRAKALYPKDGDIDVPQDLVLTWGPGEKAATHDVYFGEDANAVAAADTGSPEYQGRQADTTFVLSDLEWGKTYAWRIDEVNTLDEDSPWTGTAWTFTTADFIVVDNFEGYSDDWENADAIWEVWIDGLTNGTGSIVGYFDAPFCEQTIVYSGSQSMPFDYNNIISPYYSEAELPLDPAQDWTVEGVSDLTLYIQGNSAGFVETSPGQYRMSANSSDIWGTSDNGRFVYKQLNGDGAISAKVLSVDNTSGFAKGGVMIRESLDPASSYAFMFPTPSGRRAFQNRPSLAANAISAHSAEGEVTYPVWVKVERKGSEFTAYYSTDGTNWIVQPDTENTGGDASPNPQTIFMTGSVYIGLALSSNNAHGGVCFAEFSDVLITGSVSGQYKVADLGDVAQSNDPDDLYVALQDSNNNIGVVVNPDPAAVNVTEWTEWKIPLTEFGVNLSRIKTLFIGVGDRDNPTPDGAGLIYIDDIRVTRPAAAE